MDLALLQVMRDVLLRRSEASALRWGDVELHEDGSGRLHVTRSKTDQTAEGAVRYLGPAAVEALVAIRPNNEAVIDPGTKVFGLSAGQISRRIKAATKMAGLGDGYSGHSPRVGMAQDLSAAGAELPELMTAGRWDSPTMPAKYTEAQAAGRELWPGITGAIYGSDRSLGNSCGLTAIRQHHTKPAEYPALSMCGSRPCFHPNQIEQRQKSMDAHEFVAKWRNINFGEKQASQEMFLDICALVDHPTPVSYGDRDTFTLEKHVPGGDADAYLEGHFGWEFKGSDNQLTGLDSVAPIPGLPEDAATSHRLILPDHPHPNQLPSTGDRPP